MRASLKGSDDANSLAENQRSEIAWEGEWSLTIFSLFLSVPIICISGIAADLTSHENKRDVASSSMLLDPVSKSSNDELAETQLSAEFAFDISRSSQLRFTE